MSTPLTGKVALVTGASKGIGASIALHLAAAGAKVAVNYASSRSGADRVVSEINGNGGKAVALQADVSKEADVVRLFNETEAALGKIDILVNNAGVYEFAPLEAVTAESFHRMFDLNVLGLLFASREFLKHTTGKDASIINISSVAATSAPAMGSVYSATKGAVDTITKSLAAELGPRGIRVNAINPGMVETEGVVAQAIHESEFRKIVEAQTPLGRIGKPKDIGPAAVFLASPDASWISGQTLHIAGGFK